MAHSTKFEAPGWGKCVLIHDGYDMPGKVEIRAWYKKDPDVTERADYLAAVREDGKVTEIPRESRVEDHDPPLVRGLEPGLTHEKNLLYAAGLVIGRRRFEAKIVRVIES